MKKVKENSNTKAVLLAVTCIILFGLVSIGTAYSFISAHIIGNETNGDITVKTANVYAMFEGNDLIAKDILPGYSDKMTFTITNTSETADAYGNYSLIWNINKNEINNNNFVYKLEGKTFKNGEEITESIPHNKLVEISETRIPEMSSVLGTGTINTGITHKYTLTIMFKETGVRQNESQVKSFDSNIVAKGEPVLN